MIFIMRCSRLSYPYRRALLRGGAGINQHPCRLTREWEGEALHVSV